MRLDQDFGVSPAKLDALKARAARLGLDPARIQERFSRGSGKGGQKLQKTSSRVQLSYAPLGLNVCASRERSRSVNRFLALRELVERAEILLSPETSPRLREIARRRRRKARAAARSVRKYARQG